MKTLSLLVLVIVCSVFADTLLVPSEYASIYDAITAAQSGDTVLVSPGHYNGGFTFQGKNIVLTSTNGASSTFIKSPFADFHCVIFSQGEDSTAVLEGFSITNWGGDTEIPSDRGDIDGGGIYIKDSSPTIRNNVIYGCDVNSSGAGIFIENSSALIENNTIIDSYAHSSGGAIYAHGSSASGLPLRIIGCYINGNSAQTTGGLHVSHQNTQIINNIITDNQGAVGGIRLNGLDMLICGNLISANHGSIGGGINISGGTTASIIGNVITENEADIGGGIYEGSGGLIYLFNNTITSNSATQGGGIRSAIDSISCVNMIIWGNAAEIGSQISLPASINESYTYIEYSCIEYGQDSINIGSLATLDWGQGNIDTDPLFEAGPICDYHLSMDSPCIDAGNPDPEYNDPEDPFNPGYALWPAMGYLRNDMGAFGGGSVGYWLSVEEEEQASPSEGEPGLICYPNPSNGSVSIMIPPAFIASTEILVYDISGKLVRRFIDLETNIIQWDCDDESGREVPSGVYLIQGISGDQSLSVRFVKI